MSPKATVQSSWVRDVQLTTRYAKSITPPKYGQVFYFDAEKKELALRVLPSGLKVWVVNLTHDNKLYRRVLRPLNRCTAEEARKEADIAIGQIKSGGGEYVLGREQKRLALEDVARLARTEKDARAQTLRRLCELYVADLEKRGKASARDAASTFRSWVYSAPEASRPACKLEPEDVAALLRRVVKAKHGRTAAKLRAYLRAAYQRAAVARADPDADEELGAMVGLEVKSNPVASVASLSKYNVPDSRPALTEEELGEIFKRLASDDSLPARAAWVGVLLGGQRPAQLMRAKVADYGEKFTVTNGQTRTVDLITIYDPKGRRDRAREHIVPAVGEAAQILGALAKQAKGRRGKWLFSTHGKIALRHETVSGVIELISDEMAAEAKKARQPFEPFTLKHLRTAAETQLAALGVSEQVRAQLLSHGLGGLQNRHYQKYDFMKEKLEALELWHARIAQLVKAARKRAPA